MTEIFRDTALGAVLRYVTKNRVLQYPEEKPGFKVPDVWMETLNNAGDEILHADDEVDLKPVEKRSSEDAARTSMSSSPSATDEENTVVGQRENNDKADEEPYAALRRASTAHSHNDSLAIRPGTGAAAALQHTKSREETLPYTDERLRVDELHSAQRTQSIPVVPRLVRTRTKPTKSKNDEKTGAAGAAADETQTAIVVDWYSSDDPENPQNWSNTRRAAITFLIGLYTFVVYTSSAIYTTSEEGVMETFGVDATRAALGLSMFVLGYGMGPLLFSPLSEIPSIGRNPVYAITMIMFVVISLPTALAYGNLEGGYSSGSFGGLITLRFLQGFFGSPCLASGAASLGDMYALLDLPFALVGWVSAAYCGPALGPLLSGFSVPVMGWRWSLLEILWASAPVMVAMLAFLPETAGPTILLRRARRIRAATGDARFLAPSEIAELNNEDLRGQTASQKARAILVDALIKPLEITLKDPAILFVQVYSAIIYAIYYSFFEAFPLVYPVKYGMSSGQVGLVFLCILVSCLIGVAIYCSYLYFYLNPRIRASGTFPVAESRLIPGMIASFGPTIGLFIFAWTANGAPEIPWIAPTIGITVYGATVFVIMQCIFVYVPLSYPQYAASLFAGNDFFRSAFACGSVLFGRPLYMNLGVARGTSLLGGLSTIGILGIWLLYFYGARLRALSKFAVSN